MFRSYKCNLNWQYSRPVPLAGFGRFERTAATGVEKGFVSFFVLKHKNHTQAIACKTGDQ